jgi:hypothetical protein
MPSIPGSGTLVPPEVVPPEVVLPDVVLPEVLPELVAPEVLLHPLVRQPPELLVELPLQPPATAGVAAARPAMAIDAMSALRSIEYPLLIIDTLKTGLRRVCANTMPHEDLRES